MPLCNTLACECDGFPSQLEIDAKIICSPKRDIQRCYDSMEFVTRWRDKGQPIAKDLLRLSVQDDFKNTHGHWPENVELECLNPDIGVTPEDNYEGEI